MKSAKALLVSGALPAAWNPNMPSGYLVDTLFRKSTPDANASAQDTRGEATRILASGLKNGDVSQADRTYLAQLVAARTGLSQDDAQKRVDAVVTQAGGAGGTWSVSDCLRKAVVAFMKAGETA